MSETWNEKEMRGFGIKTEDVGCEDDPRLRVLFQHYRSMEPFNIIVRSNYGIPTIHFPDGSWLKIFSYDDEGFGAQLVLSPKSMVEVHKPVGMKDGSYLFDVITINDKED